MSGDAQTAPTSEAQEVVSFPFAKFCSYFLWLGTTGFGGPIALTEYMQRDLVERRHWVSREDYLEGLALAQLAPGPLAAHGYLVAGPWGALSAAAWVFVPVYLVVSFVSL
jgi:chromate transporter